MTEMLPICLFIVKGTGITLVYTLFSSLAGGLIGTSLGLLKFNKIALYWVNMYISFLRGTPLIVQLTLVYFVLPSLIGFPIPIFVAGCIAFSLNASAYIAEIIFAGLNSVDKGQFEVCHALDIPSYLMCKDIIFPQAIKTILPGLINEAVTLLKETALISVLGEQDIMRRAQLMAAEHYTYIPPLMTAAICYYGLTLCIEIIGKKIAREMAYDSNN